MSTSTKQDVRVTPPPPADRHDLIRVHGARVNNLKDVFEGTPAALVAARSTLTGEHLEDYVGARAGAG